MSEILISARFDVHAGKQDEFEALIPALVRKVRENEPEAKQYNWYHSDDHSKYVVLERYSDSDAVLVHLGNVGDLLGALLEVSELKVDLFGTPTAELSEAVAGIPTRVYTFERGL
jgi:quinol monooxygenase YgiN